jgi:hypothetical protein
MVATPARRRDPCRVTRAADSRIRRTICSNLHDSLNSFAETTHLIPYNHKPPKIYGLCYMALLWCTLEARDVKCAGLWRLENHFTIMPSL